MTSPCEGTPPVIWRLDSGDQRVAHVGLARVHVHRQDDEWQWLVQPWAGRVGHGRPWGWGTAADVQSATEAALAAATDAHAAYAVALPAGEFHHHIHREHTHERGLEPHTHSDSVYGGGDHPDDDWSGPPLETAVFGDIDRLSANDWRKG